MSKKVVEKTGKLHEEGFNCAESVLLTVASEWGVCSDLIPRIATAFGGGVGRQGYVCGALSGGVIAIGLKYGRDKAADISERDKSYTLVRELFKRFKEEFGSINCRELIGLDLTTSEGIQKLRILHPQKCAKYIARTADIVLELT